MPEWLNTNTLFFIALAGFFLVVIYSTFAKRGREWTMGGRIVWSGEKYTIEESEFSKFQLTVQVHKLEAKDGLENFVCLEVRSRSATHFNMMPISASKEIAMRIGDDFKRASS